MQKFTVDGSAFQTFISLLCKPGDVVVTALDLRLKRSRVHGHSYKLCQQFSNCTSQSKCFSERVVTLWNSLPGDRVNFSSLHKCKSSLKSIDLLSLVH